MIVLIGFMGSGKSTVGRLLATRTGLPFADTDALIEAHEGAPVAEIFEAKGEPYFRELERKVVTEVLDGAEAVVALGGGAIGDPVIASALEWANVVYLETSFQEVSRRIGSDEGRPLLRTRDPGALFEERVPRYRELADFTVQTDRRDPGTVAAEIEALIIEGSGAPGERRVVVPLGERAYAVVIGNGILHEVASYLEDAAPAEKAFIVTHPPLLEIARRAEAALQAKGLQTETLQVPEGEGTKTLETAGRLLEQLGSGAAHRNDLIVPVGGGVVCDLAGFVASVYARGMRVISVPTSLLAQVDAAIGGKTGVNLTAGKNLAGTFHQPSLVVCDVGVLDTLDDDELRSGLAEVVKYGLISDLELLDVITSRATDLLQRDHETLAEVVARSVWIKAAIVAEDETDRGRRQWLNYGHTFAHAIEHSAGFGGIRHGFAVSLGMMAAAYLSNELGWLDDAGVAAHKSALDSIGLPTTARLTLEELEPAWLRDKKYEKGVRFVLLSEIGSPVTGVTVQDSQLERALERLRS